MEKGNNIDNIDSVLNESDSLLPPVISVSIYSKPSTPRKIRVSCLGLKQIHK